MLTSMCFTKPPTHARGVTIHAKSDLCSCPLEIARCSLLCQADCLEYTAIQIDDLKKKKKKILPFAQLSCYDFPLDSYLYSYAQHSTVMHSLPQSILSQPNLILTHPLVPPDICLFLLDYITPTYSLLMTHQYIYKP